MLRPPTKKALRHNPHSRRREKAREQAQDLVAFHRWWRNKIDTGVLVNEQHAEGLDYKGEKPWPEWVSLRSLWYDYVTCTGRTSSYVLFRRWMLEQKQVVAADLKNVTEKDERGRIRMYTSRVFFHISQGTT